MATTRRLAVGAGTLGVLLAWLRPWGGSGPTEKAAADEAVPVAHPPDEWRKRLSSDQFAVLRGSGTERPYTSALLEEHRKGTFSCAGCGRDNFSSDTKFESGTGWPSFWAPLDGAVIETSDYSLLIKRTEVHCSRCGGHLGHVFGDGPRPTGLRYCMNGVALAFRPETA